MENCKIGNCQTTPTLWAEHKVGVGDLQTQDSSHPNLMPFSGTLLLLDEASDQPPHGAETHRILVRKEVAEKRLNTLPGMAINYSSDLTGHDPSRKVGVITEAWIKGNKVKVNGVVWKKDFPQAEKEFKQHKGRLGMSMELGDVWVADKDDDVWDLQDFHFTGATVLLKDHAAYEGTDLAASKHFVFAMAAAREAEITLYRFCGYRKMIERGAERGVKAALRKRKRFCGCK